MTSLIGLALALWFGPTPEQVGYCMEAGWSYEVVCVNDKCELTEEAKEKVRICDKILELKEVKDEFKYY